MSGLPPEAYAGVLAAVPGIGPRELRAVLRWWQPEEAWQRVVAGQAVDRRSAAARDGGLREPADRDLGASGEGSGAVAPSRFEDDTDGPAPRPDPAELRRRRQRWAAGVDVEAEWARWQHAGVGVAVLGDRTYPAVLAGDPEAPAVLFWRGDLAALDHRRVCIVGTRRCSSYGREVARDLGHELAVRGVAVVSGLAWGIDGAAHEGALRAEGGAPPVAVVGSGVDVPYPRRHRTLWERVAAAGAVLSEAPMGGRPLPWRFPLRNRILAVLAEVVVVVESHAAGGSLLTAQEADRRDRAVFAVPGSIRSPASVGTNLLLRDGKAPLLDVADVLVALGLGTTDARQPELLDGDVDGLTPIQRRAVEALGWEPATLDQLAARTGEPIPDLALALVQLESDGVVTTTSGWWERRPQAARRR